MGVVQNEVEKKCDVGDFARDGVSGVKVSGIVDLLRAPGLRLPQGHPFAPRPGLPPWLALAFSGESESIPAEKALITCA